MEFYIERFWLHLLRWKKWKDSSLGKKIIIKFYKMKIIFYKIKSLDDNKCYVGSTNNLRLRMNKHKQDYKNYLKDNTVKVKVCTSIEILKNNYEIIILEEIEYETLEDLKNRYIKERYYIENSENVVNKQIPSMTVAERKRIYYKNNKQKILERQNAYYKDENKRMRNEG